jgi:hypothetical protein
LTNCTRRWEITSVARAKRDARGQSQHPSQDRPTAVTEAAVLPRWVTAAHAARDALEAAGEIAQRSINARSWAPIRTSSGAVM